MDLRRSAKRHDCVRPPRRRRKPAGRTSRARPPQKQSSPSGLAVRTSMSERSSPPGAPHPGEITGRPDQTQPCSLTIATMRSPASVGLRPTFTPASVSASILAFAVPLPPETIAPAWPIFLPAGAVTPATYAATGLLILFLSNTLNEVRGKKISMYCFLDVLGRLVDGDALAARDAVVLAHGRAVDQHPPGDDQPLRARARSERSASRTSRRSPAGLRRQLELARHARSPPAGRRRRS